MKRNLPTIRGKLLICILVSYTVSSSNAAPENQNVNHLPVLPSPDKADERQKWFLDYIQEIADDPSLSDADQVARLLQANFTIKHSEQNYEKGCDASDSHKSSPSIIATDNYIFDKVSWFRAMPDGVQHMHIAGGGFMNPKSYDLGDPHAGFYISKTTTCGGRKKNNPGVSVHIYFDNIPGFVCITQNQLRTLLPQATNDRVTDGGVQYSYRTGLAEYSGVLVRFSFPPFSMADECLTDISIEQDERYSKKEERVNKEFWDCLNTKHVNAGDPACGGIPELMNKE